MRKIETALKDAFIFEVNLRTDERGNSKAVDLNKLCQGNPIIFERWYTSTSALGVVRGMHIARFNRKQFKFISCIKGKIQDVLLDLRKESKTYLQKYSVELTGGDGKCLLIPPGIAHGFQALEEESIVSYLISDTYSIKDEITLNPYSIELELKWPLDISILSSRDKSGMSLIEVTNALL